MFRLVSIVGIFGIAHDPRSLKLHVVPNCRFVQHESLDHYMRQDSIRRFLLFLLRILDQIGNQRRCVSRILDLSCQTGNKKCCFRFLAFISDFQKK